MPAAPGFSQTVGVNFATDTTSFLNSIQGAIERLKGFNFWAIAAGSAVAGLAFTTLQAATEEVIAFESALVELRKVAGTAIAENMEKSIREMATTMPVARQQLISIATEFGRAGVSSSRFMEQLTRVAAEMSIATDVMAGEAVRAIVKLQGAMGLGRETARNLGASVNALANNLVTSSSEIVQSAIRSSAALSNLGASADQVLALNAAFIRVSPSARRAGTRIRRVAEELQAMSEEDMNKLADAIGMTTERLQTMIEERPVEAIKSIGVVSQNIARELNNIFGTRVTNAFQNLGNVIGDVNKAMQISKEEFEEAASLQEEYRKAIRTTRAQMQELQNQMNEFLLSMGQGLQPEVKAAIKGFSIMTKNINEMESSLGKSASKIGVVSTGLFGLATAIIGVTNPMTAFITLAGAAGVTGALVGLGDQARREAERMQRFREEIRETNETFKNFKKDLESTPRAIERTMQKSLGTAISEIQEEIEQTEEISRKASGSFWRLKDAMGSLAQFEMPRGVDEIKARQEVLNNLLSDTKNELKAGRSEANRLGDALSALAETGTFSSDQIQKQANNIVTSLGKVEQAAEDVEGVKGLGRLEAEMKSFGMLMDDLRKKAQTGVSEIRGRVNRFVSRSDSILSKNKQILGILSRNSDFFDEMNKKSNRLIGDMTALKKALRKLGVEEKKIRQISAAFKTWQSQVAGTNRELQKFGEGQPVRKGLLDVIEDSKEAMDGFSKSIDRSKRSYSSLLLEQMVLERQIERLEKAKEQAFKVSDDEENISGELAKADKRAKKLKTRLENVKKALEGSKKQTADWRKELKNSLGVVSKQGFKINRLSRGVKEVRRALKTLGRTEQLKQFNKSIRNTVDSAKSQEAAIKGVREQLKKLNIDALKTKAQIVELNREFQKAGGTVSIAEQEFQKMRGVMNRIGDQSPRQVRFWRKEVNGLVQQFKNDEISESQFLRGMKNARESMELWNPQLQQFRDTFENVMTDIVMTGNSTAEDFKKIGRAMAKNMINHFFKNFIAKKISRALVTLANSAVRAIGKGIGAKTGPVAGGKGTGENSLTQQLVGSVLTSVVGGATSAGVAAAFGDTPGIMQMKKGGNVRLAEGDKFVASQSLEGLKNQVNRMESNQGQSVVVEQHNTFTVDVKDEVQRQIGQALPKIQKVTEESVKRSASRSLHTQNQIKGK